MTSFDTPELKSQLTRTVTKVLHTPTQHLVTEQVSCFRKKISRKYLNCVQISLHLQRAITPKIAGIELWFLYDAHFCNVIYLCVKFEGTSFYTLEVMPWTKIHS